MLNVLANPIELFSDLSGDPLDGGYIYLGEPNTNPVTNPVTPYLDQALTLPAMQPLRTTEGVISVSGSPRQIYINEGSYSLLVLDKKGNVVQSSPNVINPIFLNGASAISFDGTTLDQQFLNRVNRVCNSIAELRTLSCTTYTRAVVTGYYAVGDRGGGNYWYDPSDTTSADNGGTVIVATDGARWKLLNAKATISARQFGVKGDGATDDTARLQAFADYVLSNNAIGFIDEGNYLITSQLTLTVNCNSFMLRGAGNNATTFRVSHAFAAATPAIQMTWNSGVICDWSISDFSINPEASGAGACTAAFQIGDPANDNGIGGNTQFARMEGVQIGGGFPVGWDVVHARMIKFTACGAWNQGAGVPCVGINIHEEGYFTGDLVFDSCQFVMDTTAGNECVFLYAHSGAYSNTSGNHSVAGVKFLNCDFYGGNYGIHGVADNGALISDIWIANGCQFDQKSTANVVLFQAQGAGSWVVDIHILDCMLPNAGAQVVNFTSLNTSTVSNVIVRGNYQFLAESAAFSFFKEATAFMRAITVEGNTFADPNIPTGALIEFNGVQKFMCLNNVVVDVFGTANVLHMINIDVGCSDFYVSGNDGFNFTGASTINDQSGDVTKLIVNNVGLNPIPITTITVGASPFAFKNTLGSPLQIMISGGTVSALVIGGVGVAVLPQFILPPGVAFAISYSVAPTIYMQGV